VDLRPKRALRMSCSNPISGYRAQLGTRVPLKKFIDRF